MRVVLPILIEDLFRVESGIVRSARLSWNSSCTADNHEVVVVVKKNDLDVIIWKTNIYVK
jgi:hypothetical protein